MYVYVAAHRGNVDGFPENSMLAFQAAYEVGVDMIETDIRMTKDGEIVLMHDESLNRTSDIDGVISEMTFDEIMKADIGIKTAQRFKGIKVPTLRELFEYARRDNVMTFNLEFKDYFKNKGEVFAKICADKIISLVEEYRLGDRCIVNSFDGAVLKYIDDKYEHRYRIHGFYPFEILGDIYPPMFCACLWHRSEADLPRSLYPEEDYKKLISLGIEPWVGASVDSEEDILAAVNCGARLFTTNRPKHVIEILEKHKLRNKE
ncbi:MAG: hypothetical protein GX633_04975 [Clostridiales bacterium]|nr:hypothetical protein [Clostridiales bacterium]